jgi:hypothetical protein
MVGVPACELAPPQPSAPDKSAESKEAPAKAKEPERKALNKKGTLFLEVMPDGKRRVLIESTVCLREGQLEQLLTRKQTKEHEAILTADVDGEQVHAALLAAGAKAGTTVQYQPTYKPATGTTIKIMLRYQKDGKTVTVPAREWVRNAKSRKDLDSDWVFAGSLFVPDPLDKNVPPTYAANGGDLICVSNFPTAMLDLPINSPKDNSDLSFEAHTERIPELKTKVTLVLEPVEDKKDEPKK